MAGLPQSLSLERHRDVRGRTWKTVVRLSLMALLTALLLLGLLNVFGQRPVSDTEESPEASLKVYSPSRVRGGLFFESRFTIKAHRDLKNATLVLDPGWLEGMTLNTLAPGPIGEASRDGKLAFELGHIPAGNDHFFFLHFQVNPTNVGYRSQNVELHDGERRLLKIDRTITIWP